MKQALCVGILVGLLLLSIARNAKGADWPNWRGPNFDGISTETKLKTTWSGSPKVLWEYPVGSGFSSFTSVKGRAYTCGTKDGQQVVFCFDAATGKVIWQKTIEQGLRDRQGGDGPRATPTIDDGRVYVFGAHGQLLCLDAGTGREIWKRKFNNKPNRSWAYAGSVLIEGDLAVVAPGRDEGGLLALNKKTGKEVWKCADDKTGYSTPYPFTFKGKRYIVGFLGKVIVIADAKTGREVWRTSWKTSYDVNASTPIFHDGHLFISSGYGTGCALFKLSERGGQLDGQEVWRSKAICNKFQTCVLKDGILYGGDERGLKCVDFMTGAEKWSESGMRHATVVLAGGHLIVLSQKGKLAIAKATPAEFKPIAEADVLSGRCWTVPTLSNGKLYMRNLSKAVCLDLGTGVDRAPTS